MLLSWIAMHLNYTATGSHIGCSSLLCSQKQDNRRWHYSSTVAFSTQTMSSCSSSSSTGS
jgi:hypothetical protein